jgi:hypothetical protein
MQLSRESAVRREADFRLELGLRSEVDRALAQHIGELRDEIAALRTEVVEKVNGQLWLERVETTRVIASDLEALQSELRRIAARDRDAPGEPAGELAAGGTVNGATNGTPSGAVNGGPNGAPSGAVNGGSNGASGGAPNGRVTAPAESLPPLDLPAPAVVETDGIVDAEIIEAPLAGQPPAAPEVLTQAPAPLAAPDRATEPPAGLEVAGGGSSLGHDPFADLPRLSPLPEDVAGLLQTDPEPVSGPSAEPLADSTVELSSGRRRATGGPMDDPRYVGRRRANGEDPLDPAEPAGRRRAPLDAADDLLARLRRP